MKKLIFFFLMMLLPMVASAYDAFVDGIYYNLNQTDKMASVTYYRQYQPDYSGDVAIPKNITYEGNNYKVTGITANAFYGCGSMTSVTIPSSVTSIGIAAFSGCI